MFLYLDDCRPVPPGWVLAETAEAAIRLLQTGEVKRISLDHDLGPPEAGTGYDVACWIEEHAAGGDLPPLLWDIHSANPVGRDRMTRAMQNAERFWATHRSDSARLG